MSESLFTAEEVAAEVGVEVQTIYTWVRRGFLAHSGRRGHLKLFKLGDAFAAEKQRNRKHRKRQMAC